MDKVGYIVLIIGIINASYNANNQEEKIETDLAESQFPEED